jgi:hypothetical protein
VGRHWPRQNVRPLHTGMEPLAAVGPIGVLGHKKTVVATR